MNLEEVNVLQDYELAEVNPGLVVGISLDKVNGRRMSITIRNSRLEKAEWVGDMRLKVNDEGYLHGKVVVETDQSVLIDPLPYVPSPYPMDVNLEASFWIHPEVKYWTPYASKSDSSIVAYANEITKRRLVFSQVKSSIAVSSRIQEKEQKGYVLSNTSKIKDLL